MHVVPPGYPAQLVPVTGSYGGHVGPEQLLPSTDQDPHGAQLRKSVPPHEFGYVHFIPPGTGHGLPAGGSYGGHVGGGGHVEPAIAHPVPVPGQYTSSKPPHAFGYSHLSGVGPQ